MTTKWSCPSDFLTINSCQPNRKQGLNAEKSPTLCQLIQSKEIDQINADLHSYRDNVVGYNSSFVRTVDKSRPNYETKLNLEFL